MQHGYFDDFRKLRDTNGKIFPASEQLIPAPSAPMLPGLQVHCPAKIHIKYDCSPDVEASMLSFMHCSHMHWQVAMPLTKEEQHASELQRACLPSYMLSSVNCLSIYNHLQY